MLSLLQLLLPEVATHHHAAVLVNAVGEVLAGHTDQAALPVRRVVLVDKAPLLRPIASKHTCTTSSEVVVATGLNGSQWLMVGLRQDSQREGSLGSGVSLPGVAALHPIQKSHRDWSAPD